MTTVKACGFTRAEDVAAAERLGVDWIGLVFAPSKRRVEVEQAARLRAGTRLRCMGVFVDAGIEKVRETARRVGLDGVQLHGVESPEDCRRLRDEGLFVVKAFSALLERPGAAAAYKGAVDAVLVDAGVPGERGGRGQTFRWQDIPEWRKGAEGFFLWIAGGLRPENVQELLRGYRPDGVDVSSGIETGVPGVKDVARMEEFVRKVREWDDGAR
ncbi:phosphoribosylanthranilate isomerase [Kyrpidia sp.]|uniref:phosphoribosylanthranilate isomerase n=1 Tax=Kyrpidia sp. TaxID=2073077 RepID=UPI00258E97C8|nr:phosphoribosylanthranilate isomerase [Kyrpidia sp.]MCL6574562.1 phosphoribosylanthranilate isomerase [Kyrpidia sp.]